MTFGATRGLMRLLVLLAALVALLAGCAAAPGALLLSDQSEALARGEVEAAAAPLVARGARVAVFVAERGDDTGADLTRLLGAAGLLEGGEIAPAAIALYVSYEPRYSELRAGTDWSEALPDATLREIRTGTLNPALRGEQPSAGVTATLAALEARLASPPLLVRLQQAVAWVMYALLAGLVLWLLGQTPLGPWLRRTPPVRLAQWLRDQTPSGRQRLTRITTTTRRRLEERASFARGWCVGAAATPAGPSLMNRLKILDQERAALDSGSRHGRTLEQALDDLAWRYTSLGHEAERLNPRKPQPKAKKKKATPASAAGLGFTASDSYSSSSSDSYSSSSSDSSSSWDSGSSSSSDSGPSSDSGSW